jgi:hypothetical protein
MDEEREGREVEDDIEDRGGFKERSKVVPSPE